MLSLAPIWAPQAGQADRCSTIDSLRGTRSITTVRKEPTASPKAAKATARITSTVESYAALRTSPCLSVRDLAEIRGLHVVAGEVEPRDQDREVVHDHLVRDVHGPTDDLPVEPIGVVVAEVHGALGIDEHPVSIVEVRIVGDIDVVVSRRAVQPRLVRTDEVDRE